MRQGQRSGVQPRAWCAATRLVSTELAGLVDQVRRDGAIRETELLMSRPRALAAPRHRPGGAAQLAAGAGPGRGPHPRAAGRGGPARLRRQREPRAEDAGRRDPAARRGRARRGRRPGGGAAVQRADDHRVRAADPTGAADHRAVAAAGRRPGRRAARRAASTRSSRPRSTPVPIDADAAQISVVTGGAAGLEVFGNTEQITAAIANLVANAIAYSGEGSTVLVSAKGLPDSVEISVVDQGIGIPEQRGRADLRALLPRRPGAPPFHRRDRPRALDRQARRRHPRRRHQRCGPSRGKDPRSPSLCPAGSRRPSR